MRVRWDSRTWRGHWADSEYSAESSLHKGRSSSSAQSHARARPREAVEHVTHSVIHQITLEFGSRIRKTRSLRISNLEN